MSVRVNFVPLVRLQELQRRRRGSGWLAANAAVLLTLLVAWGIEQTANHGLTRLTTGLATLEQQRTEIARRRSTVEAKERVISERLDLLAGMDHGQRWPARLLDIVENTSERVVLSGLQILPAHTAAPARAATPKTNAPATAKPSTQPAETAAAAEPAAFMLRLVGRAADHESLMGVLAVLQRLDGASEARLVHATRDAGEENGLLSFELECRIEEPAP